MRNAHGIFRTVLATVASAVLSLALVGAALASELPENDVQVTPPSTETSPVAPDSNEGGQGSAEPGDEVLPPDGSEGATAPDGGGELAPDGSEDAMTPDADGGLVPTLVVPAFEEGLGADAYFQMLEEAGLVPTVVQDQPADHPDLVGVVYDVSPAVGTDVAAGSSVTVYAYGEYAGPSSVWAAPTATITLMGRDMAANEFTFVVTDRLGQILATSTGHDAAAAGERARIYFDKMEFAEIGEYSYYVRQLLPAEGDVKDGVAYYQDPYLWTFYLDEPLEPGWSFTISQTSHKVEIVDGQPVYTESLIGFVNTYTPASSEPAPETPSDPAPEVPVTPAPSAPQEPAKPQIPQTGDEGNSAAGLACAGVGLTLAGAVALGLRRRQNAAE